MFSLELDARKQLCVHMTPTTSFRKSELSHGIKKLELKRHIAPMGLRDKQLKDDSLKMQIPFVGISKFEPLKVPKGIVLSPLPLLPR